MTVQVKDFQKATAERIFHIYKHLGRRRVLLADEVGLGKTLVAREVINLVRQWHQNELHDDFFKVVYICSNANIANQNIEKLGVSRQMNISEGRLSMQHLYITLANKENAAKEGSDSMPESIIPLTPSTSFCFFSAQGTVNERALIYDIVSCLPPLAAYLSPLSDFMSCGVKNWSVYINNYQKKIEECGSGYLENILSLLQEKITEEELLQWISLLNTGYTHAQRVEVINRLRRVFAEISIDMVDPDLVIMDEFQRFNSLLESGDDEQSMLVRRFFDEKRNNTKILLLSATPYKPYSTLEELNTDGCDEHYRDFMKVIDFLFVTKDDKTDFRLCWQRYSAVLQRTEVSDLTPLLEVKNEAESALYSVMCRTERFNSGIIDDSRVKDVHVLPEDILSYARCQYLMNLLSEEQSNARLGHLPIEYVKSASYLLSFMDKYELKKRLITAIRRSQVVRKKHFDGLLLSKYDINNYRWISPANGKLSYLHDLVFGNRRKTNNQFLLWIPASYPYYRAGGLFETEEARSFSKIILFSSWEMVPRMVSVMMSYYSELYTIGELKKRYPNIRYTSNDRMNRLHEEKLLVYPCQKLAAMYDPKEFYGQELSFVRQVVQERIRAAVSANNQLASLPPNRQGNKEHLLRIMQLLDGGQADHTEDLTFPANAYDVLTDLAIASPAICAYRQSQHVEDAGVVGKAIVSLFTRPEGSAVIKCLYNKGEEYISVLDYCVQGNLQAVLDEYAHMLGKKELGSALNEAIIDVRNISVDTLDSLVNEERSLSMRCYYAIPFNQKTFTDKSMASTTRIRKAFNSPFRPFLLSTTSIGQEGLDFHWYARKIVHWNLPSNPVDLEQREGRINRFKCLAIRRNVAHLFKSDAYQTWDELFEKACHTLKGAHSHLVPYWCLPTYELSDEQRSELQYIERIVPLYPLSRDHFKYDRLIQVLALYRMTLGQPRQEELLKLLKKMNLSDEQVKELTIDLCPFHKK